VAYRGIVTETLQEANLFRWSDSLGCTLFIDVKDVWHKAEKRGAEDILLGRFQRNGNKVARVTDPQAGSFRGVAYYDVYGPTVMAVNEPLRDPLLSRSIVIVPPEAAGKYPNIYAEEAVTLKERLTAFRARMSNKTLPAVSKPVDGRLGDILQPIGQVAAIIGGEVSTSFPGLARYLAKERLNERAESREARVVTAIRKVSDGSNDEKLSVSEITSTYNEGLTDKLQISEESMGRRLSSLGFKTCRLTGGGRGRLRDENLLSALVRKYGIENDENDGGQEPSLPSLLSSSASIHVNDGLVTVGRTVMTDAENRHSTVTQELRKEQIQNSSQVTEVTVVTVKGSPPVAENLKPVKPCYMCGNDAWWQRPDGGWVCGVCHPKP
jgi:hypothetical protein